VVAAPGGEEGLALARRLRPDVVTLDVRMPGMDGWEVLAALKGDPELADTPVVMLSVVDDREAGLALGVADYLVKPVTRERLLAVMARYRVVPEAGPVLVVDDDPDVREVVRRTLAREGWTVHEAADGREGLARAAAHPPALVVLDLVMPEMDGFAFVDAFRRTPAGRETPVVVLTSKELSGEERERLAGSVERVLRKGPHPRDELLDEVRRLLRTRESAAAEAPRRAPDGAEPAEVG
jgi:CheY-like chemotaxis protein